MSPFVYEMFTAFFIGMDKVLKNNLYGDYKKGNNQKIIHFYCTDPYDNKLVTLNFYLVVSG